MEVLDFINFIREVTKTQDIFLIYDFPFDRVILKNNHHKIIDVRLSETSLELVFTVRNVGPVILKKSDSYGLHFPNTLTCAVIKELRIDLREPIPKLFLHSDHDITHPFLKINGQYKEINLAKFNLDNFRGKPQAELVCKLEAERIKLQYTHRLFSKGFRLPTSFPESRKQFFEYLAENNVDFDSSEPENFVLRTYMDTVTLLSTVIKGKNTRAMYLDESISTINALDPEEQQAQKERIEKEIFGYDNTLAVLKWQIMLDPEFVSMDIETDDVFCVIKKKL